MRDFLERKEKDFDFRAYGLPEIESLNFQSFADIEKLCRIIQIALFIFEPRVSASTVHFVKYDQLKKAVYLYVQGFFIQDLSTINIVLQLGVWEFSVL